MLTHGPAQPAGAVAVISANCLTGACKYQAVEGEVFMSGQEPLCCLSSSVTVPRRLQGLCPLAEWVVTGVGTLPLLWGGSFSRKRVCMERKPVTDLGYCERLASSGVVSRWE